MNMHMVNLNVVIIMLLLISCFLYAVCFFCMLLLLFKFIYVYKTLNFMFSGRELYSNNISGKVPPELGNLTNLVSLDLYLNNLSGTIPDTLSKLQRLRFLYDSFTFITLLFALALLLTLFLNLLLTRLVIFFTTDHSCC